MSELEAVRKAMIQRVVKAVDEDRRSHFLSDLDVCVCVWVTTLSSALWIRTVCFLIPLHSANTCPEKKTIEDFDVALKHFVHPSYVNKASLHCLIFALLTYLTHQKHSL